MDDDRNAKQVDVPDNWMVHWPTARSWSRSKQGEVKVIKSPTLQLCAALQKYKTVVNDPTYQKTAERTVKGVS
jgi:hypothetical protein